MTASPAERPLPPPCGRPLFGAIGYLVRGIKGLPMPLRERALDTLTSGVSTSLPPFPDVLRLVEAAGGIPDGKLWQDRLLADHPALRAVSLHEVSKEGIERVRARLYLPPEDAPKPNTALVWVHGGAFVLGSLDAKEAHWLSMELAAGGIPVVSVDYRMCIGGLHYPAPLEDVLSAWNWAVAHCDELGIDTDSLHMGGGSAGGCLVASAILRLRDAGEKLPASQILAYPVLEGRLPSPTPEMVAGLAVNKVPPDAWVAEMFANWSGAADEHHPYVAPAFGDPEGLPPTLVLTCGRDALRRSSEPYARKLAGADVAVWHEILPEAEHAPLDRPGTPDGAKCVERIRTWLTGGIEGMAA